MDKKWWIVIVVSIIVVLAFVLLTSNVFVQLGPKKVQGEVQLDELERDGWIAILPTQALIPKKVELEKSGITSSAALTQHRNVILEEQQMFKEVFNRISRGKVTGDVHKVGNYVFLDDKVTDADLRKLEKEFPGVEFYPNLIGEELHHSDYFINKINVDDVWNLDAAGGVCSPVSLSPPQESSELVVISPQCQEALIPLNNIINTGASPTARNINDLAKCTNEEIGEFTKGVSGGGAASTNSCSESAASDINNDGAVNVLDMIDLLLCYGQPAQPNCLAEDINNDGSVNVLDLIQLLLNYGQVLECQCTRGQGVIIGIIDFGTAYTHNVFGGCSTEEFLAGECEKFVSNWSWDFRFNDPNPSPDGNAPHGTHVASIAVGKYDPNGNNEYDDDFPEYWGIAPDARLVAYRIGGTLNITLAMSRAIEAIDRSTDPNQDGDFSDHLDIISMSFGFNGNPDDPVATAVDNAVDAGVVAVAAAGNAGPSCGAICNNCRHGATGGDSNSICSPGTARKVITVGATNSDDQVMGFSSRGPVIWTNLSGDTEQIDKPDLVAPGHNIGGAIPSGIYQSLSGTSMSSPMVAGAAALLLQKNPDLSPLEVKQILTGSALNLGISIWTQGSGRLDVLAAFFNGSVSNESHGVCLDSSCMIVPGSGIDECVIDADCPTCGDGVCEGNEDFNNCPADNCPSHLECVSQACVPVPGAGAALCSEDTNCTIDSLLVFVSDTTTFGNIGNTPEEALTNADAFCNSDAAANNYTGIYSAWISTSTENASDRIVDGEYRNIFDQIISNDKDDLLDGSLNNSIHPGLSPNSIWTGTYSDGTIIPGQNCNSWTTVNGNGRRGFASTTTSSWTASGVDSSCSATSFPLYCFQVS